MQFIQVTKDNKAKDKGLIAVDAICSVFENSEAHNVSIMTMDGFWYDVVENIDTLWAALTENSRNPSIGTNKQPETKFAYLRRKKMLPATISENAPVHVHDNAPTDKVEVIGRSWNSRYSQKRNKKQLKSSPTGVGDRQGASAAETPCQPLPLRDNPHNGL